MTAISIIRSSLPRPRPACCSWSPWSAASAQQPGRPDPERAFSFGDTDLDGKLSLDEFRELLTNGPRQKNAAKKAMAPEVQDGLFRRLDANRDGSLTVQEFRRLNELRAGGGGRAGPRQESSWPTREKSRPARARPPWPSEKPPRISSSTPARSRAPAHTRADQVLRDQNPAGAHDIVRQVPLENAQRSSRAACSSTAARACERGRHRARCRARQARREPADHGDPLHRRLASDAPQDRLPKDVVADFETWVKMGAPDPRDGNENAGAGAESKTASVAKGSQFWSFQPPKLVKPPAVNDAAWPRTDIDRFLLAALEAKGSSPSPTPIGHVLISRVSFDLVGLPPSPGGSRGVPGRSRHPTRSRKSSSGCSRRPGSASAGAGTGSTWRGLPNPAARPT